MDKETISLAVEKKFTEFSDAIKTELKHKLASHEEIQNYTKSVDNYQHIKDTFANINNSGE